MPEAALAAPSSVGAVLAAAVKRLRRAGCETPRLDAELLLGSALGVDRARLVMDRDKALEPDVGTRFAELVARRADREPVAYILGRQAFRYLELTVDRRVLIPRPETELLVEVGLTLKPGARVIDVGTGSGAVALALAQERPDLRVVGIDVSDDALAVARANAARLGLEVEFVCGDLLAGRRADAVLANLPYVAGRDAGSLSPEIASFEPGLALFGGEDGLDLVRRLVAMLDGMELVALEVGCDQADRVASLLASAGYTSVERMRDLAGHERVVLARR
ncbi:MAG: peptide chain release factor N(5)-glutamine methyltransferase [Solirubrobacteraceae bacterium]